jgi:hypothetical protein
MTNTTSAVRVIQSPTWLVNEAMTPSPSGTLATVAGARPGSILSVTFTVTVGTSSIM